MPRTDFSKIISVHFQISYLENKVGDPAPIYFCISDTSNSLAILGLHVT